MCRPDAVPWLSFDHVGLGDGAVSEERERGTWRDVSANSLRQIEASGSGSASTLFPSLLLRAAAVGKLWGLMQFAIWHCLFIERPGLKPAPDEDLLAWIRSD